MTFSPTATRSGLGWAPNGERSGPQPLKFEGRPAALTTEPTASGLVALAGELSVVRLAPACPGRPSQRPIVSLLRSSQPCTGPSAVTSIVHSEAAIPLVGSGRNTSRRQ